MPLVCYQGVILLQNMHIYAIGDSKSPIADSIINACYFQKTKSLLTSLPKFTNIEFCSQYLPTCLQAKHWGFALSSLLLNDFFKGNMNLGPCPRYETRVLFLIHDIFHFSGPILPHHTYTDLTPRYLFDFTFLQAHPRHVSKVHFNMRKPVKVPRLPWEAVSCPGSQAV